MKPLLIAQNSMRRYLRDRRALFFSLIFPVLIILVVGSATSQFGEGDVPFGVTNEASSPLARALVRELEREPTLTVRTFDDASVLAKAVRRGIVPAGVVVPVGYDTQVRSGHIARVRFLFDQSRGFPAAIRSVVTKVLAKQGTLYQAASFAAERTKRSFDSTMAEATRTSGLLGQTGVGVATSDVGTADAKPTLAPGFNYQVPSVLLLFVFITSLAGAGALIENRRIGVTRRMLGTPTTARAVLGGEALSRFALAAFQAVFIFVVGTVIFRVKWGQPLGAVLIILMFVGVGTSMAMLMGSVLRTPEQAASIGPPIGITLGMLGGCMWPLEIVPKTMQTIGHFFPHAWAMDAWIALIGRGAGVGDILPQLGVLTAFVAVLLPLAAWRLRRTILTAPNP